MVPFLYVTRTLHNAGSHYPHDGLCSPSPTNVRGALRAVILAVTMPEPGQW